MRHVVSGVVSVGHFDNFCCWQYGQNSSAHKDGIDIMLQEIAALSRGNADFGRVEVSVVGGYSDARGDAARNSLSLLRSLHQDPRTLELKHFCVGRFNTVKVDGQQQRRSNNNNDDLLRTETTALLKGIAVDTKTQQLFPASFEWGNYEDFHLQIKDRFRLKSGKDPIDTEEANKTADSTFKPKSLRNRANHEYLLGVVQNIGIDNKRGDTEEVESSRLKENLETSSSTINCTGNGKRKGVLSNSLNSAGFEGLPFKVKLRPTVINDKGGGARSARKPARSKVKAKKKQEAS